MNENQTDGARELRESLLKMLDLKGPLLDVALHVQKQYKAGRLSKKDITALKGSVAEFVTYHPKISLTDGEPYAYGGGRDNPSVLWSNKTWYGRRVNYIASLEYEEWRELYNRIEGSKCCSDEFFKRHRDTDKFIVEHGDGTSEFNSDDARRSFPYDLQSLIKKLNETQKPEEVPGCEWAIDKYTWLKNWIRDRGVEK